MLNLFVLGVGVFSLLPIVQLSQNSGFCCFKGVRRFPKRALTGERKMRTNFFLHKLFEYPQGSGTSQLNSRDIPDSSLRNPRKTNFRGRARTFRPPPLRMEDPPHPTGGLRTWKVNLCALFSCLNRAWKLQSHLSKHSHRIAEPILRHYRFLSQRSCCLSRDRRQLRSCDVIISGILWGGLLAAKDHITWWMFLPREGDEWGNV